MTTVVTGARGNVGRRVVAGLVQRGEPVRAVSRDGSFAGEEVVSVRGDLLDPAGLEGALEGAERLFLFPVPESAPEVLDVAARAGVGKVVVLSSSLVTSGVDTTRHAVVEAAARDSSLAWTAVRPGEFADNRRQMWARSIREERVVRFPDMGRAVGALVHEADIADVAVSALLEDGHDGEAYTLTGPDRLSVAEQVDTIADAIGEPVRYEKVSPERAAEILRREGGWIAEYAELLAGVSGAALDAEGRDPEPDENQAVRFAPDAVRQVTGSPARSFAQWASDHRTDFL